jgi:hypothetical protein
VRTVAALFRGAVCAVGSPDDLAQFITEKSRRACVCVRGSMEISCGSRCKNLTCSVVALLDQSNRILLLLTNPMFQIVCSHVNLYVQLFMSWWLVWVEIQQRLVKTTLRMKS